MDIVAFEKIETSLQSLPDEVSKDLSRDQQLLYNYMMAVASGSVSAQLAGQVAGPINHSRWLTLAIRILQLYTRTKEPSTGLKMSSKYVMQAGVNPILIFFISMFENNPK